VPAEGHPVTAIPPSGRPSRWTVFAASWLLLAGIFNIVGGVTAIHRGGYYQPHVVAGSITTWGWVMLIIGVLQMLAALLVFAGSPNGYALGIAVAMGVSLLWFFLVFAAPFGALIAVLMNALVIYGLTIRLRPRYAV